MRIGSWARILLAATPLLACFLTGCGDFWESPYTSSGTSFTLSPSPATLTMAPGATTGNTSTITVTPSNSFTGTVGLSCAVSSSLSNPTSPGCSLSPTSVSITGTSAETSVLTVTTAAGTTLGAYTVTVTGTSGGVAAYATVCAEVSTSSTCTTTATTSGDFYILNNGTSGSIAGYSISGGKLNDIGSPVSLAGVTPYAIAIAPSGNFLSVSTSNGVYAYPLTNGVLGTGVQVTSDAAYSIQIDSTDSWLIEAVPVLGGGSLVLNAVPINPTNGTYTLATIDSATITIADASLPYGQMFISGDNKNIFLALEAAGTIVVPFSSSNPFPAGGTYAHIPVGTSGGTALSVAVDPGATPSLFYIGETLGDTAKTSGGLRAFTYSSLPSLSEIASSPIASGGLAPTFILPVATPDYVYVADGAGSITGFEITAASGPTYTISKGSTVTAGDQPTGMAEDSTGSYVFEVGSAGSPYFDAYTFDPTTTGLLDSQVTSTAAATSIAIVAAQ